MSRNVCPEGQLDIILVTGDAYVDHPAWGVVSADGLNRLITP